MNTPNGDQAALALQLDELHPAPWLDWRKGRWACLDLEMTGLGDDDRIVEIAIVTMQDGAIVSAWSSLVNPGRSIPPEATAIHGITDAMVASAPTIQRLEVEIVSRLHGADAIVGYNVYHADEPWLRRELPRVFASTPPIVDALVIVRRALKYIRGNSEPRVYCPIWTHDTEQASTRPAKSSGRHSLGNVAQHLQIHLPASKLHRAEADAGLTGLVLHKLIRECNPDVRKLEVWARQEAVRQANELESWFAKKRQEDAQKRQARDTLEGRLMARMDRLEEIAMAYSETALALAGALEAMTEDRGKLKEMTDYAAKLAAVLHRPATPGEAI